MDKGGCSVVPKGFLCYARENSIKIFEIYKRLQEAKFLPWMDKVDLIPS